MAVIAKMNVQNVRLFGDGNALIALSCVYDNDLQKDGNEDARFTKASPYGDAEVTVHRGPEIPESGAPVYLILHDIGDPPSFDGCMFAVEANCSVVHDFGYSKQVEVGGNYYDDASPVPSEKRVCSGPRGAGFKLKMGIDNPGASVQFVPTHRYFVAFYDATKLTMAEALKLARS